MWYKPGDPITTSLFIEIIKCRGVTSGTVTLTEMPFVSYNKNIMPVITTFKALTTWLQAISLCCQGMVYGPEAKGGVTHTENLEDWSQRLRYRGKVRLLTNYGTMHLLHCECKEEYIEVTFGLLHCVVSYKQWCYFGLLHSVVSYKQWCYFGLLHSVVSYKQWCYFGLLHSVVSYKQ